MAAAAKRSINALCSAMRSSSGLTPLKSGLARAICHKWVWAKSGLKRACLWKGRLCNPGVDIRGNVGNPAPYNGENGVVGASEVLILGGEAGGGWGISPAENGVAPMVVVLGTIVGELAISGLRDCPRSEWRSVILLCMGLDNSLAVSFEDDQDLGGEVGLSDDEDKGDTSVDNDG